MESVDETMDGGGVSWVIVVAIALSTRVDVEEDACRQVLFGPGTKQRNRKGCSSRSSLETTSEGCYLRMVMLCSG